MRPYEDEIKKVFPVKNIDDRSIPNRVFVHLPVIVGNDHEEIAETLADYYFKLKEITDRIK